MTAPAFEKYWWTAYLAACNRRSGVLAQMEGLPFERKWLHPRMERKWEAQLLDYLGGVLASADGAPLRILDVGCGVGGHAAALMSLGHSVVGADCEGSAFLPVSLAGPVPVVRFTMGRSAGLPFFDGYFDLVFCFRVLNLDTITSREKFRAIEEMVRVTRPGGSVVLYPRVPGKWTLPLPCRATWFRDYLVLKKVGPPASPDPAAPGQSPPMPGQPEGGPP